MRHARNKLRLYGMRWADIEQAMVSATSLAPDGEGRVRWSVDAAGRALVLVVAGDDPELVVTIYSERR